MNSLQNDFKNAFRQSNNAVAQLIIINIVIWLVMITFKIISVVGGIPLFAAIYDTLALPDTFSEFKFVPWTILTYAFMHSDSQIFHIIFNMLTFYWFGRLIQEYLGSSKVISLYVLGAIAGGVAYLIAYNFVPVFQQFQNQGFNISLVGASASVLAIAVAAATLIPEYRFNLMFIGPVKIVYIAAFMVLMSYVQSVGSNAGGNIAHLGGAVIGFVYIKQLRKGRDFGKWVISIMNSIKSVFKPKAKMKVTYKSQAPKSKKVTVSDSKTGEPSQEEIDIILDKISQSGYESLSKSEKEKLFNASKK